MEFVYDFIPAGSMVIAKPGTLYLDVGNKLENGVIDHHHPGAPQSCSTRLVLEKPELILSQVDATTKDTSFFCITTHDWPDFDAVASVYCAQVLLSGGPIEAVHWQLADYIEAIDQGHTRINPATPINPYSLFMMLGSRIGPTSRGGDRKTANVIMLQEGLLFIDALIKALWRGSELRNVGTKLANDHFQQEQKRVLDDLESYRKDVEHAHTFKCLLPQIGGKTVVEVPGIWATAPKSRLFKSWARGDVQPDRPDGFVLTIVKIDDQRTILSVEPASGVYLKGLGDILNQKEMKKRKAVGQVPAGTNRPGYDLPDPWYDGRSSLHNYTIIDSPQSGTLLTEDEIHDAFAEYQRRCKSSKEY